MFIGFGPVARGLQTSLNLGAMLVLFTVQAVFSLGHRGLVLADAAVFVGLVFVTFQQSRMLSKGVQIAGDTIRVRSHWFERTVPLSHAATLVVPHSAKPVKVVAADGGYASAALSLALMEPAQDKAMRDAARDRAADLLAPSGVLVTHEPMAWASGAFRDSDHIRLRVMTWTVTDTAWAVPVVLVWLAIVLL